MTHSYTVDGITCEGCVAKVKHKLLSHPDITAAEVSLEGQKAVITMQRHLTVDELQDAIGRGTKYVITEDKHATGHNHNNHEVATGTERSWFDTYKPILLIFALITSIALISATQEGTVHGMMFMNNFMGGFFLAFSFFKLLNLDGFADSYAMYDIVAKKFRAWGYIYAFIELGLGFAYVTEFNPTVTNAVTFVVMTVSLIGVLQSVLNKRKIRCACLGAVFNLPMSTVTIVEDALMIVMSAITLWSLLM
jgi:copper chaperone CopZ